MKSGSQWTWSYSGVPSVGSCPECGHQLIFRTDRCPRCLSPLEIEGKIIRSKPVEVKK